MQNMDENIKMMKKKLKIIKRRCKINEEQNKNNHINIDSKENFNLKYKNKNIDAILISKKVFKIEKKPKYNDDIKNINNIINKQNNPNNNIIINYNNHNNNIFNTLLFNNEYKVNHTSFLDINSLGNSFQNPYNNYLNDLQINSSINSKYIQSLFLGLKKEMADILKIVDLSKKDNNKLNYLSQAYILNQKIINYFKVIENCVIFNLKFLNNINLNII